MMRVFSALLATMLLAACDGLSGCAAREAAPPVPGDPSTRVALGREWFGAYCASCHGEDGSGDGPVAETLREPLLDLDGIAARREGRFDADEIASYAEVRIWSDDYVNLFQLLLR